MYVGQRAIINNREVKDGFGKLINPDGSVYEGQFENEAMNGTG